VYNYFRERWLVDRLANIAAAAFGAEPRVHVHEARAFLGVLMAGPRLAQLTTPPHIPDQVTAFNQSHAPSPARMHERDPSIEPATDDWPFLYLRVEQVAPYYLAALAFILLFAVLAVLGAARVTATPIRRFSPHFFVLGIAFLLLETKSLVSFSLLFGTTWVVNALAFFAILASVLLAIVVNLRFRPRSPAFFYAGLFAALAIAYLVPADALLIDPPEARYVLAAAIAFAPVFFANLVFTYSFRDTDSADMSFASNLLGAMFGGALEYVALVTGFQALLLLVGGLYAVAFLLARRFRFLADRELVDDRSEPLGATPAGAEVVGAS
jgi:hypothetical protein